jgi:hypothetical protein
MAGIGILALLSTAAVMREQWAGAMLPLGGNPSLAASEGVLPNSKEDALHIGEGASVTKAGAYSKAVAGAENITGWAKNFEETGKGHDSFQWDEALMERLYLRPGDGGSRVSEASDRDYDDVKASDEAH